MTLNVAIEHQEPKEATRRAHCPRDGRRRQTCARHAGNPLTQVLAFKLFDLLAILIRPTLQLRNVARVTLQRVGGEPFLHLNIAKKFADKIALMNPLTHREDGSISSIDFSRRAVRQKIVGSQHRVAVFQTPSPLGWGEGLASTETIPHSCFSFFAT